MVAGLPLLAGNMPPSQATSHDTSASCAAYLLLAGEQAGGGRAAVEVATRAAGAVEQVRGSQRALGYWHHCIWLGACMRQQKTSNPQPVNSCRAQATAGCRTRPPTRQASSHMQGGISCNGAAVKVCCMLAKVAGAEHSGAGTGEALQRLDQTAHQEAAASGAGRGQNIAIMK